MNRRNRPDHGKDCTCGCQDSGIQVTAHDLSCAGSVKLTLDLGYEEALTRVGGILSAIGAEVTEQGGIVGHLKALVTDMSRACMLSVTDEETAARKELDQPRVLAECACIVMALEPEELKAIMTRHFAEYL